MSVIIHNRKSALSNPKGRIYNNSNTDTDSLSTGESEEDQELQLYLKSLHKSISFEESKFKVSGIEHINAHIEAGVPTFSSAYYQPSAPKPPIDTLASTELIKNTSPEGTFEKNTRAIESLPSDASGVKKNFRFGVLKSMPDLDFDDPQELSPNRDDQLESQSHEIIEDIAEEESETGTTRELADKDIRLESKQFHLNDVFSPLDNTSFSEGFAEEEKVRTQRISDDSSLNPKISTQSQLRNSDEIGEGIVRGVSNLNLMIMDRFILEHVQVLKNFVEQSRQRTDVRQESSFRYTTLEETKEYIKHSLASRYQK